MKPLDESKKTRKTEREIKEKTSKKIKRQIDPDEELSGSEIAESEPVVAQGPLTGDRPGG